MLKIKVKIFFGDQMKKFIILIPILAIIAIFFSCDTVEEEVNYTYSIDSVWWSDQIDGNADGYPQFERLNFNVQIEENTSQNISGRVYYKLKEASSFSFYAFSEDKKIMGSNEDNYLFVSIGNQNKELQRGIYDFSIEIFQNNQSDIKAEPDSLQLVTLSSKQFEQSANDNTFTLNISWIDKYDRTGNGYNRSAFLVIDANNNEAVTRNLDAKLYYKRSEDVEYQLYKERSNFEIYSDSDNDTIIFLVGVPNTQAEQSEYTQLEYGEYDFRVDITETGKSSLLAFQDVENPRLSKQKFETEDEDSYYFSIDSVWWSDPTDLDGDSYTSLRKIHFDVNLDKNETKTLFAKIYLRSEDDDSTDYNVFYDSTSNFTIRGTKTSDTYSTWIGLDTTKLDSNRYDILISVYDAVIDSPQVAEATVSSILYDVLKLQPFETAVQDSINN